MRFITCFLMIPLYHQNVLQNSNRDHYLWNLTHQVQSSGLSCSYLSNSKLVHKLNCPSSSQTHRKEPRGKHEGNRFKIVSQIHKEWPGCSLSVVTPSLTIAGPRQHFYPTKRISWTGIWRVSVLCSDITVFELGFVWPCDPTSRQCSESESKTRLNQKVLEAAKARSLLCAGLAFPQRQFWSLIFVQQQFSICLSAKISSSSFLQSGWCCWLVRPISRTRNEGIRRTESHGSSKKEISDQRRTLINFFVSVPCSTITPCPNVSDLVQSLQGTAPNPV